MPRIVGGLSGQLRRPRGAAPIVIAVTASAIIIGAGWLTLHLTRLAHENMLSDRLESARGFQIEALDVWAEGHKRMIYDQANARGVRRNFEQLVQIASASADPREAILSSDALADLRDVMPDLSQHPWFTGWYAYSTDGLEVASFRDEFIGLRLSPRGHEILARVLQGESVVTKPYRSGALAIDVPESPLAAPVISSFAPIYSDAGEIIGALQYRMDSTSEFTRILSAGRWGESGETYVFDESGLLLSESRFASELRELGLLGGPDTTGALAVQIRDPGVALTKGEQLTVPVASLPLTRVAASAILGESGVDVSGYRNYRGVTVVGAWAWIDSLGLGIVTEMDHAEAMRPLQPGSRATRALFALLVAGAVGLIGSSLLLNRLRRKFESVRQLGQYVLGDKIGEGGMGVVYHARHALLRRSTAIKLLKPEAMSPEAVRRFQREVQITAQLSHPNTIEVYDYGRTDDDAFYYAMEFLDGLTLQHLIRLEGSIDPARAVHILIQICGSLAEAHAAGLVHRDIKPANIFLCDRGGISDFVKVLDFGMVKETSGAPMATQDMSIGGTPGYIAPERFRDPRLVDPRLDIYAVGCVAFNLLTGREVFPGASAMEIVSRAVNEPPPRPTDHGAAGVPRVLDDLVVECLAREPDDRVATAAVLARRLVEIPIAKPWTNEDAADWWSRNDAAISSTETSGSFTNPAEAETASFVRGSGLANPDHETNEPPDPSRG